MATSHKNLAVSLEDHGFVKQAMTVLGSKNIQTVTHELLQAGLRQLAPEVVLPPHNAQSNMTVDEFKELYRDEESSVYRRRRVVR